MVSNPLSDQEIAVQVGADTSGFESGLANASSVTTGFKSKLSALGATLVAGGAAAGLGIAAAFGKATQAAAGFQESMVGVEKVTSEATADELGTSIRDMAEEIPQAQGELAGIAETAGRLGVEGSENIETFTRTVAEIATATNLSADEGADAFARIAELTNEPIENIRSLGDVVNGLSNNMGASAREITDSMTRASGTLTQLGLSTTEIAGLSAAMNEVSSSSRLAGTQLRRLGQELVEPKKVGDLASALGMTEEQFVQLRENNPNQIIRDMAETMSEGGEQADILRSTLSTTSRQALSGLGQNFEAISEAQQSANQQMEDGNSLTEEFNAANSTFNAQMQRLQNRVRNVGIEIGQALLPHVSRFFDDVSRGVGRLQRFIRQNDIMRRGIQETSDAFSGGGQAVRSAVQGDWSSAFDELESVSEESFSAVETMLVGEDGSGGSLNTAINRGGRWLRNNGSQIIGESADTFVNNLGSSLGSTKNILIGEDGESGALTTMVDQAVLFLENDASRMVGDGAQAIGAGIRAGVKDFAAPLIDGEESVFWAEMNDIATWLENNSPRLLAAGGQHMADAIVAGFTGLVDGLVGEEGALKQSINEIATWLEEDAESDITSAVAGWGDSISGGLRSEINENLNLPFKIEGKEIAGREIGSATIIPALAEGGIVTQPTMAMVGEGNQSEAVVPLDKLERMLSGNMGGGSQPIIVRNVIPGEEIREAVDSRSEVIVERRMEEPSRASNRNGGRFQ